MLQLFSQRTLQSQACFQPESENSEAVQNSSSSLSATQAALKGQTGGFCATFASLIPG